MLFGFISFTATHRTSPLSHSTPAVAPLAVVTLVVAAHIYRRWFSFDRDRKQLQDLLEVATGIQAGTTVDEVESALVVNKRVWVCSRHIGLRRRTTAGPQK